MNTRYILYGMALLGIMLTSSLSSQAQDIKFSDKPYSTPVFSATFPVDQVVKYEQTKDAAVDRNEYTSNSTKRSSTDSTRVADPVAVMVSYTDYSNTNFTKVDLKELLDRILHRSEIDLNDTPSTIGGLDALASVGKIKVSDGAEYLEFYRVAAHGNRMWIAGVICFVCTQADADKFFGSIKIK